MSDACEAPVLVVDEPFTKILYCRISFENHLLLIAAFTCEFFVMAETFDATLSAVCLVIITFVTASLCYNEVGYVLLKSTIPFGTVLTPST